VRSSAKRPRFVGLKGSLQTSIVEAKLLNLKANGQLLEIKLVNDLKRLYVSSLIKGYYMICLFICENAVITRLIVNKLRLELKKNRLNLHREVQPIVFILECMSRRIFIDVSFL